MERLYQMHVIPDIVPSLQPTVDLRVAFPEAPLRRMLFFVQEQRESWRLSKPVSSW